MNVRKTGAFEGFDFTGFWSEDDSSQGYHEPAPTDESIAEIEHEIGFRLPDAYVELARLHNGGELERPCYPMKEASGWAADHIAITGIFAVGCTAPYSLLGELGTVFMRQEWGYPSWGIGIADAPSAGHEQVMLDYRACGPEGEPRVVHVDQERDYAVTFVAPDFATFVRGLVLAREFDRDAELADSER